MTSSASTEDSLECPYCFELYDDPVLLSCTHSMCKKCALKSIGVHSIVKANNSENKNNVADTSISRAVCARCNKQSTTDHTPNVALNEQVTQIKKNVCGHCEERPVDQDCLNCGFGFCAECKTTIHAKGMFSKHQFASAGSLKRAANKASQTKQALLSSPACRDHQKPLDLFCKTCQMIICDYCERIGNHKGHPCISTADAVEDCVVDVKTYSIQLSEAKKELDLLRNYSRDETQATIKSAMDLKSQLEAAFNRLESTLLEAKQTALKTLQQHINRTEMESAVRMTGLETLSADAQRLSNTCAAESKTPALSKNDRLLLRSHISTMGQDLNSIQLQLPSQFASSLSIPPILKQSLDQLHGFSTILVKTGVIKSITVPFGPGTSGVIGFTDSEVKFLSRVCGIPFTQSRLLYKASRDGFANSTFHRMCDKQGACLVIVRNQSGHVFGAYTSVGWKSAADYVRDDKACLFSLSQGKDNTGFTPVQLPLIKNESHALYDTGSYGPTFGTNEQQFDLHLNLDILTNCHSVLGGCYRVPPGVIAQNFLAGTESFWKIDDVIVYRV